MTRVGLVPLLVMLGGCPVIDDDTDIDTDIVTSGCPEGLERASSAAMVFSQFTLDGSDYFLGFDAAKTYGTVPAACIDADGTHAELYFDVGTEAFGLLTMEATSTGSVALTSLSGTTIDLFGAPQPFVVDPADWQTGTANVNSVGSTLQIDFNGTASGDGHVVVAVFAAEASP